MHGCAGSGFAIQVSALSWRYYGSSALSGSVTPGNSGVTRGLLWQSGNVSVCSAAACPADESPALAVGPSTGPLSNSMERRCRRCGEWSSGHSTRWNAKVC
jgi:hypothetical protein